MKSMRPSPLHEYISRATRTLVTEPMSSSGPWWGAQHVHQPPGHWAAALRSSVATTGATCAGFSPGDRPRAQRTGIPQPSVVRWLAGSHVVAGAFRPRGAPPQPCSRRASLLAHWDAFPSDLACLPFHLSPATVHVRVSAYSQAAHMCRGKAPPRPSRLLLAPPSPHSHSLVSTAQGPLVPCQGGLPSSLGAPPGKATVSISRVDSIPSG